MHVYVPSRDPTFGMSQRQSQPSERYSPMRRSLYLALLALATTLAACADPAGPARDGEEGECRDGVIVGTQTRCEEEVN
jgi:hypothetical protein